MGECKIRSVGLGYIIEILPKIFWTNKQCSVLERHQKHVLGYQISNSQS